MNFLILVLLLCFVIFLYIIYVLSHEDFVILRRDVSMEKIFNGAFLFGISGLFMARFVYVFFHPSPIFHSFLGFLLFPYFPGLSMVGGLIGSFGFAYLYFKSRNLPIGRLMDFFSISFLASYPLGLFGILLLSRQAFAWPFYVSLLLSFVIVVVFVRYVLPLSLGGKLKDGSLSFIFFSSFSFVYILISIFLSNFKEVITIETILSLVIIISSFSFLVKQEELLKLTPKR